MFYYIHFNLNEYFFKKCRKKSVKTVTIVFSLKNQQKNMEYYKKQLLSCFIFSIVREKKNSKNN